MCRFYTHIITIPLSPFIVVYRDVAPIPLPQKMFLEISVALLAGLTLSIYVVACLIYSTLTFQGCNPSQLEDDSEYVHRSNRNGHTAAAATIIITVPHSGCFEDILTRHCDKLAKDAADMLENSLRNRGFAVHKVYSTDLRQNLDYNRKESRGSAFRETVRNKMIPPFYLIDVHSFPRSDDRVDDKLYLLTDEPGARYVTPFQLNFASRLDLASKSTRLVVSGSPVNDIVKEAHEVGGNAILIEFPEWERVRLPEHVNNITDALVGAISKR